MIIHQKITSSVNDAYEDSGGTMTTTGDIKAGHDGSGGYLAGFRFQNLKSVGDGLSGNVNFSGDSIDSYTCQLKLRIKANTLSVGAKLRVCLEWNQFSASFSTSANDISNRSLNTGTFMEYDASDIPTAGQDWIIADDPTTANPLRAIIGDLYYGTGIDDLVVVIYHISGTGSIDIADSSSANKPELHLEFGKMDPIAGWNFSGNLNKSFGLPVNGDNVAPMRLVTEDAPTESGEYIQYHDARLATTCYSLGGKEHPEILYTTDPFMTLEAQGTGMYKSGEAAWGFWASFPEPMSNGVIFTGDPSPYSLWFDLSDHNGVGSSITFEIQKSGGDGWLRFTGTDELFHSYACDRDWETTDYTG
jgi:hypothetical protein